MNYVFSNIFLCLCSEGFTIRLNKNRVVLLTILTAPVIVPFGNIDPTVDLKKKIKKINNL